MFYIFKKINSYLLTLVMIFQIPCNNSIICMNPPLHRSTISPEMLEMMCNVGLRALNNEKAKQAALAAAKNGSTLAATADSIFGVTGCAYNIWRLGKDVKSYIAPTEAQKARAIAVEEMLEFHKSKKALQNCLINNAHLDRNASGKPKACEDAAHRFARAASDEALDEIINIFNHSYTE